MNTNTVTNNAKQIVTVAVITYHSATTVLETLDSIVSQTYGPENIELIISDDGSKDNTVEVVSEWLKHNRIRFHSAKFFANEVNGGISKNCNVAWKSAKSEWIKTIAGDDILLPDCLVDNVKFILNHSNCSAVFSLMQEFKNNDGNMIMLQIQPHISTLSFFEMTAKEQYRHLLIDSFNFAPTSFIKRSLLISVGFADEKYKLIEDLPLWLKITGVGNKLFFFNKVTVFYRYSDSVSRTTQKFINVNFIKTLVALQYDLVKPNLLTANEYMMHVDRMLLLKGDLLIASITRNKSNRVSKLFKFLISLIRPKTYIYKIKQIKLKHSKS